MKVYIVEAMRSLDYENLSWIEKTFDSEEKASEYVDDQIAAEDGCGEYEQHSYIITEQEVE